jgi:hypothetical protein
LLAAVTTGAAVATGADAVQVFRKLDHFWPAGTVPAVFIAFHCVLQPCIKLVFEAASLTLKHAPDARKITVQAVVRIDVLVIFKFL